MSPTTGRVVNIIDNPYVRLGTVMTVVMTLIMGTWTVSNTYHAINYRLAAIEQTTATLAGYHDLSKDWSQTDMKRWCREATLANPNINFRCDTIE